MFPFMIGVDVLGKLPFFPRILFRSRKRQSTFQNNGSAAEERSAACCFKQRSPLIFSHGNSDMNLNLINQFSAVIITQIVGRRTIELMLLLKLSLSGDTATWQVFNEPDWSSIVRAEMGSPVRRLLKSFSSIPIVTISGSIPVRSWIGLGGGNSIFGSNTWNIAGNCFPISFTDKLQPLTIRQVSGKPIS